MATVNVRNDLYERLARQAATRHTTVDELVSPALERLVEQEPTPHDGLVALDQWLALIEKRANRYPPGFVVDDSRDAIYEGCGE